MFWQRTKYVMLRPDDEPMSPDLATRSGAGGGVPGGMMTWLFVAAVIGSIIYAVVAANSAKAQSAAPTPTELIQTATATATASPTATGTVPVDALFVNVATATPSPMPTHGVTEIVREVVITQPPIIITQIVPQEVQVTRVVPVSIDRWVKVTELVPATVVVEITSTPGPTQTPWVVERIITATPGPTQTPWVVTATITPTPSPTATATATLEPTPDGTPGPTATATTAPAADNSNHHYFLFIPKVQK